MILLTGAAGYIGSHLSYQFKINKIPFIGIDNFSAGNNFNMIHPKIKKIDIGEKKKILYLIKKYNIKHVIHAAAFSYPVESELKSNKYRINNYLKTKKFVDSFKKKGLESFIFLSSSNVYSEKSELSYKETDKVRPKNVYGKYKYLIERYLIKKKNIKKVIILRLFNVVGFIKNFKFNLHSSKNQRLISIVIRSMKSNKPVYLNYYKLKKQLISPKRDFIEIKDLTKIILKILKNLNKFDNYGIYNIGSGKKISLETIINKIKKFGKKKLVIEKKLIDPKELNVTWCSKKKIEKKISIKLNINIDKVIKSSLRNIN